MLHHTFCHFSGVGPKTEKKLWEQGVLHWEDALQTLYSGLRLARGKLTSRHLTESLTHLDRGNLNYFAQMLPAPEQWRLFSDGLNSVAYVDIETTGTAPGEDHITSIALYDGRTVRTYVYGRNLEDFLDDIEEYRLLVTFNGKCFDVPVIERQFGCRLDMAHIDLRFVLRGLGFKGGLKKCEKVFNLDRDHLDGVDGFFAVLLWNEFDRTGDERVLDTLLAYNTADVLSLEVLLHTAFNLKLEQTPFYLDLALDVPAMASNPFPIHLEVVEKVRANLYQYSEQRWY